MARAALGTAGAVASLVLTRWTRLRKFPSGTFDRGFIAVLASSRIALFVILFGVLHLAPRGDVPGFYFPQANAVLQGQLPYRDFASSYAPLHAYVDALFISVWRTPLAIIFASILGELALLRLWLRLGRQLFEENTLRIAALLYLASPVSLQFVTVDGQDNVLIALLLAAALLLALRNRAFLSGILVGLAAATIKFLPLLFVPAFLVAVPRRTRWAIGAALLLVVVYGGSMLLHLPILQPLTAEGAMRSAGNLPYLIESISGYELPAYLSDSLLLLVILGILALITQTARQVSPVDRLRVLTYGMVALTLALLLFSKKSWPPYLMMSLFPLCLLAASVSRHLRRTLALFALFSLTAVTEHSVWSSLLLEAPSASLHAAVLGGNRVAELYLMLHTALLAGYLWLLILAIGQVRMSSSGLRAR